MWREGDPKLARAKRIGPVWTCVVCGISIILSLSLLESKSRWAASLVTIPTIFVNIGYFWVESRTTKAKENLRRKVTASKFYTVTLAIRLRNVSIGDDFGYLWVEDGLLCFEGNQTSFKLPNTLKGLHAQKKKDYSPEHLVVRFQSTWPRFLSLKVDELRKKALNFAKFASSLEHHESK